MSDFKPYVPADQSMPESTAKALIAGVFFGILFGSANAYLGLRVGLTISTSIPVAVVTVALFRFLQPLMGKSTIHEHNISQTVGSASSSLASGIIFTIPALFMWKIEPTLLQMSVLAFLGGTLGILFMIPLRRFLIVKEHENLPYPEGTACAEVLVAADAGGTRARNVFTGLGLGGAYKALLAFLHLWPEKVSVHLPFVRKAVVGLETSPALLGVGFILGPRIGGIMVAGGLLSWVAIIPLIAQFGEGLTEPFFPEAAKTIAEMSAKEIWNQYVRYIGAGAVAAAGIITAIRALPTMYESFRLAFRGLRADDATAAAVPRTDRDLPFSVVLGGAALVIAVIILTPHVIGTETSLMIRTVGAIAIAVFAFLFVTVSSRIVGMVGVTSNPTSGMTIVTLLGTSIVFYTAGWTDVFGMAAAITVGTVVCVAASIAGDVSQDLKSGYLLGATPYRQQSGELLGVATSAFFICGAVYILGRVHGFGSEALAAPQATLMKTVVEGVLSGNLPWGLVFAGAAFAFVAELLSVPSLPFAVGIYLPLSTMTPIYVGGLLRAWVDRRAGGDEAVLDQQREQGVLLGSGLIAGEGLMGVGIAIWAFVVGAAPEGLGIHWPPLVGDGISVIVFAALGYFLLRATAARKSS